MKKKMEGIHKGISNKNHDHQELSMTYATYYKTSLYLNKTLYIFPDPDCEMDSCHRQWCLQDQR